MIISDLNHLEVVSETNEIVGSSGYYGYYPYYGSNVVIKTASVYQNSEAEAKAVSFKGDATAIAISSNSSFIYQ